MGGQLRAAGALHRLPKLFVVPGVPAHKGADKSPAFTARAIRTWPPALGAGTLLTEPGSARYNGHVEGVNAQLHDELLDCQIFSPLQPRVLTEDWWITNNRLPPHRSLANRPPPPKAIRPASAWLPNPTRGTT